MSTIDKEKPKVMLIEKKVVNRSLPSIVAETIREWIITGQIIQGGRIKEEELSKAMGVSRACIREALLKLESEELIKRIRNKHTEVIKFEEKDIEEIFSFRIILEKYGAKNCITNNKIPMKQLKEKLREISKLTETAPTNLIKRVEADLEFHQVIMLSYENRRVIKEWIKIKSQMQVLIYSMLKSNKEYFDLKSYENHNRIVKAFERKEIEKVKAYLIEHINETKEYVINDGKRKGW